MVKTTIPIKGNLNKEQGAIVLSIADIKEESDMHLITLGQVSINISFYKEKGKIILFKEGLESSSVEIENNDLDIVINWGDNNIWLHIYTQDVIPSYLGSTAVVQAKNIFDERLSLFEKNYFSGVYRSLTSYSNYMEKENLGPFSLEVFKDSTEVLFEADFTKPTHYKKSVIIEDTFAPKDGSPILLSDEKGPLQRQYFFDETTSEYKNEVVERFVFKGEKRRSLAYKNIEPGYKLKIQFYNPDKDYYYVGDGKVSIEGQDIVFNLSNEDIEVSYGFEYEVTYQLERSYNIEFNEDVAHEGFRVNLVNTKPEKEESGYYSSTEKIHMFREGNRFEEEYLAKEIELNPLINPQVQGFMYIDKSNQETNAFRITASSQYLSGDGIDTASVMVEAIDSQGNEVLSPYLTVFLMDDKGNPTSNFGSVEPVIGYNSMKARNTSGRAYYQISAPILLDDTKTTYKIFIVALDRKSGVSAQYPIYIRTVNEDQVFEITKESKNYLSLPFEYFARYFERKLSNNDPMTVFDFNQNGRLDRQDLKKFTEHFNKNSIDSINAKIIEREKFLQNPDKEAWFYILDKKWENIKEKEWITLHDN